MLSLNAQTLIATNSEEVQTLFLYEFTYDDANDPLRWTSWDVEVSFEGHVFTPEVVKHSDITQSSDGKINECSLTVGNANRMIQYYIENYDVIGRQVRIIQFFVGQTGYVETTYVIKGAKAKGDVATFGLSIGIDFLRLQVPGRIMRSRMCGWKFGDSQCGKTPGPEEQCERTLEACRAKNNVARFGGFPGIINERFYF
jgi:phage-related protein